MGILFPRELHSTIQIMASMEKRIAWLEKYNDTVTKLLCDLGRDAKALHDHLGIERKEQSGVVFVKKGKD